LLRAIRAELDAMMAAGFHLGPRLYLEILAAAGKTT
jgi:hypothetical protein